MTEDYRQRLSEDDTVTQSAVELDSRDALNLISGMPSFDLPIDSGSNRIYKDGREGKNQSDRVRDRTDRSIANGSASSCAIRDDRKEKTGRNIGASMSNSFKRNNRLRARALSRSLVRSVI